jgi:hypothetical protein
LVKFTIETLGADRYVTGFNQIAEEIGDFDLPFKVIIGDFRAMESRIFASEGSSEGEGRYKELTKKYSEWKERNFPGQAIMSLTGRLRAALTGKSEGTVEEVSKTEARFGVDADVIRYAHRHQVGWNMPMRRIVQVSKEARQRWNHVISRWTMGLFAKYEIGNYGEYLAKGEWRV